jgi:hypothetical protein
MLICSKCGAPAVVAPFPEMNTTLTTGVSYNSFVDAPYCAGHNPMRVDWQRRQDATWWNPAVAAAAPAMPSQYVEFSTGSGPSHVASTFDTTKLLAENEALRRENARLWASEDQVQAQIERLSLRLGELREIVQVIADSQLQIEPDGRGSLLLPPGQINHQVREKARALLRKRSADDGA